MMTNGLNRVVLKWDAQSSKEDTARSDLCKATPI